jgi:large subunit ribosomal protein L4
MSIKIIDINGKVNGSSDIKSLLVKNPNKQCMFEQVLAQDAGQRQATVSTLTRGEVRGGGKKFRPQKGTNQAQAGSLRASNFVGGGTNFGPKPNRNYKLYLNDKSAHLGFKSAMTVKNKDDAIFILEDTKIIKPSSKIIVKLLDALKLNGKKVLIIGNNNINLVSSARNINRIIAKN